MLRCIYCDREKELTERSNEHIWPERLGGEQSPDFFKTNKVCHRCNNLAGQFVDGEFIRTFFTDVEQSSSELHFLDTTKPRPLSLIYMGISNAPPPDDNEICEQWIGPRGERIFYFHKKDREDYSGYAKGDPIARNSNPGRVYLSLSKPNIYWFFTAYLSVKRTFKRAEFRMLTRLDAPEINNDLSAENNQSKSDRTYISQLLLQKTAHTHYTIAMEHGVRFQCKLALGFGHTLFGESFRSLNYTQTLRHGLWERAPHKLSELQLYGTSRLSNARGIDEELIGFQGVYTFAFIHDFDSTMSMIYSPNRRATRTLLTQNFYRPEGSLMERLGNEFVVLLVPGQSRFLGPYPLTVYICHRTGMKRISELERLEESYKTIEKIEEEVSKWDIPQEQVS